MEDILLSARKIIDDNASDFCNCINHVSEPGRYKVNIPISFGIFHPGNTEYYEYKCLERILEWYIRDLYVNRIIDGLFKLHKKDVKWADTKGRKYAWFSVKRRIDSGGNSGMNSEALQNRQCRIGDDRRMPTV